MEQVNEALHTAHSPTAPENLRRQALLLLEQFQKSDECGEWGFTVLRQPGAPAEARHFALQCLASLLKTRWRGWDSNLKEAFCTAVMELVESPSGNEVFMRERIALLVSGVGEKQYPQYWSTMLSDLATIWETRGPAPVIISFMALRNIAEDCVDADFNSRLNTARRTDILRQLNLELPKILPRLYAFMAKTYEQRTNDPAIAADILKAALQTLKRLVPWIQHELLLTPEMSFLNVFSFLMAEEPTRLEAVECLRDFGSRKFENLSHAKQYMEKLEEAITSLIPQAAVWSSLVFCETVCTTISGFITGNLDRLVQEDPPIITPGTYEYQLLVRLLQLMAELLKLPSLKATQALFPAWLLVIKLEKVKGLQVLEPLLGLVLDAYAEKTVKLRYDDDAGSFPDNPVADEEFIDLEEYLTLLSTLKANAVLLMKLAAEQYPMQAVDFLKERLPALVQRYGTVTGVVTVQSDAYRHFEGFIAPVDRMLGGIPEPQQSKETDVAIVQKISWLLSVLLEWQVSDPLLLYCHCLLLEGFKRFYRFLDQQLWAVLERLFQYMEYRDPAVVGRSFPSPSQLMKSLSNEALQVRRRGSNSLTEICNTVPDIVVPFLAELCRRCRELIVKGEVSDGQRPQLIEMLVVVANALSDQQQRTAFIAELVMDSEAYWENPSTVQAISTVPGFLQLLGVGPDGSVPTTEAQWDEVYDRTHALLGAINTFLGVTRRLKVPQQDDISSKDPMLASVAKALVLDNLSLEELARVNPFVPVWVRLLPKLVNVLRVLHGLWQPETRTGIMAHAVARHILTLNDDEVQTRLKAGGQRGPQATPQLPERKWPLWLNQIRQSSYQLLEKACHHKVIYYSPETLLAMRDCVVQALPQMDHRHVPWFIKSFIEPYIINCPFPLFATHLPPIVAPFLNHMMLRCSITWSAAGAGIDHNLAHLVEGGTVIIGGCGTGQATLTTEEYEMILDKIRREVTRAYVEMLQTALALRGGMIHCMVESNKAIHHQHQSLVAAGKKGGGGGAGTATGGGEGEGRLGSPGNSKSNSSKQNDFIDPIGNVNSSSSSTSAAIGGGGAVGGGGGSQNGGGGRPSPPCVAVKGFVDALSRFLVVDSEEIAVIGALCWQDQHSCRRAVNVITRILEVGAKEPKLYPAFGRDLFQEIVHALLAEHTWIVGMQNELVTLGTEIYRMLVIGDAVDAGQGQRTAQVLCELPRQVLLSLPGLTPEVVMEMESRMLRTHQAKEQRDHFKETMRIVAEAMDEAEAARNAADGDGNGSGTVGARPASQTGVNGGENPQAAKEESILRSSGSNSSSRRRLGDLPARLIQRGSALSQRSNGSTAAATEVDLVASVASLFGSS